MNAAIAALREVFEIEATVAEEGAVTFRCPRGRGRSSRVFSLSSAQPIRSIQRVAAVAG